MLVTRIRKKTIEIADIAGADKDGKKSKGKYPENLVQVPYIWYFITF